MVAGSWMREGSRLIKGASRRRQVSVPRSLGSSEQGFAETPFAKIVSVDGTWNIKHSDLPQLHIVNGGKDLTADST